MSFSFGDLYRNVHTNETAEVIGVESHVGGLIIISLSNGSSLCYDRFIEDYKEVTPKLVPNIKQICAEIKSMQWDQKNHGTNPTFNLGFWRGLEYALARLEGRPEVRLTEVSFPGSRLADTNPKPQMRSRIKIDSARKTTLCIFFFASRDLAESLREFGSVRAFNADKPDYYSLAVDGRFDFDEVVKYIENL